MKETFPIPEATKTQVEKREKPAVLYHATRGADIEEFEPRQESTRDPSEGPVVFATPDRAYAAQFLVPGDDRDSIRGYYNDIPTIVIRSSREDFEKNDSGGTVYEFPSDTFDFDPKQHMGKREWTSRKPVKPIGKTAYASTVDALIENGTQVYFVDQVTFDEMRSQEDGGFETLLTLTSENERRGKNIRKYKED